LLSAGKIQRHCRLKRKPERYFSNLFGIHAVLLFFGYIFSNPFPSLYTLDLLAVTYPDIFIDNIEGKNGQE
jgi:hypothetical protein